MPSAYLLDDSFPHRVSFRRRAAAVVLALLVNALIISMLLGLAPFVKSLPEQARKLSVFNLSLDPGPAPVPSPTRVKAARPSGGSPKRSPAPRPAPVPTDAPPDRTSTKPLDMIILSKEAFAAADISKMRSSAPAAPSGGSGAGTGTGNDSGADSGAGRGPGGERLFNAEWYREPTNAELAFYLPKRAPSVGYGMIACRTIANYRVEDCVSLGEFPSGSGFAEAVRQAAWQFRVQPPRVGAKRLVGEWVRIRIDYTAHDAVAH